MSQIYPLISALVSDAITDTLASTGDAFDFSPGSVTLPEVSFAATLGNVQMPAVPGASIPDFVELPEAQATELTDAAYRSLSSVVGAFTVPNTPPTVTYETPALAGGVPDGSLGPAPTLWPEAPPISVDGPAYAGDFPPPSVEAGTPPVLDPIGPIEFEPAYLDPLDLGGLDLTLPDIPNPDLLDPAVLQSVPLEACLDDALNFAFSGGDVAQYLSTQLGLDLKQIRFQRFRVERELANESSGRGLPEAAGALFSKLNDAEQDAALSWFAAYERAREEILQEYRQKMLAAGEAGLNVEGSNLQLYLDYAKKVLEVYEYNVSAYTGFYNVLVDLFNSYARLVGTAVGSYNDYLAANLALQDAEVDTLRGVDAAVKTNAATLEAYAADLRTVSGAVGAASDQARAATSDARKYTTYVEGLLLNIDVVNANLDGFRKALEAYAAAVQGDSAKIDAFSDKIRADGTVADVYEANAALYTRATQALTRISTGADGFNSAAARAIESEVGVFNAAAAQHGDYVSKLVDWLQSNRSLFSEYERCVGEYVSSIDGRRSAEAAGASAQSDIEIALESARTTNTALKVQRDAAQANIDAGLAASTATTYAGLASAAYAVRSIGTTLGSTASTSRSKDYSEGSSESTQYNRGYTYAEKQTIAV